MMNLPTVSSPHFGASLSFNRHFSDITKLDAAYLTELAQVAQQKDQFAARVAAIQDQKDPISIQIGTDYGQDKATVSSRANGSKTLDRAPAEALLAFVSRAIQTAEGMCATLLSPAERKEQSVAAANGFINSLTGALSTGNFEYLDEAPAPWAHEVGFHSRSSEAVQMRIGDATYQVSKTVSNRGQISYSIEQQGGESEKTTGLHIELQPEGTDKITAGFSYTDKDPQKNAALFDMYREATADGEKKRLSGMISRTKQIMATIESAGVFKR